MHDAGNHLGAQHHELQLPAYDENQLYLLPPSIADWVSEGSLARFVSDIVDHLEAGGRLQGFYVGYREDGWGRASYHPRMLVKVLLYSFCTGVTSSRRMARALENEVPLRVLSANQQPDFRTISDFRKAHLASLKSLFVEVLRLCQEAGLVKMGRVALDGRRVAGNAALDQNRKRQAIEAEVKRILAEAERVDTEENRQYGEDRRGDELPETLRSSADRLRRLREAQQRLDEEEQRLRQEQEAKLAKRDEEEKRTGKKKKGRKPKQPKEIKSDEAAKANITAPDNRILKTRQGWVQGYNGQAMADCTSQAIVAQEVTQEENDVRQVAPMLDRCVEQAGCRRKELVADAGYWSEANFLLEDEKIERFIATTKDHKQRRAQRGQGCPRGRAPIDLTLKELMERRQLTKRGRAAYRQRSPTIEAVFGQMVMRGLTRFMLRGVEKVRTEWALWCATHNLLKLWRAGYAPRAA